MIPEAVSIRHALGMVTVLHAVRVGHTQIVRRPNVHRNSTAVMTAYASKGEIANSRWRSVLNCWVALR